MAVTFPANPVNGQEYTVNNITYVYNSASDYWRDLGRAASTGNRNGTGGVTVYALAEDLPVINVAEGAMALVQETGKLFVYNSGWYNIAMVNTVPTVTGINSSYDLAHDGTATVITVIGTDSENVPLTYTYSATGLGTIATISQANNQFTITPSTSADDAGTFSVTFTVTDGVNAVDTVSSFTLSFATQITDTRYNVALITSSGTVGTSTDITDDSSSSHNITVGGDAHLTSLTPYRGGGYSVYFDGAGDHLIANVPTTNTTFTAECWFYQTADAGDGAFSHTIMSSWNNQGTTPKSWLIQVANNGNGQQIRSIFSADGIANSVSYDGTVTNNTWHHVAIVSDGTNVTVYLDGSQIRQTAIVLNTNTLQLHIGDVLDNSASSAWFQGYISDVRVVKGDTVYTSNFTPPTERLEVISNTAMLTCHRGWIGDSSSLRQSVTVHGNANTQPFAPYDSTEYNATNQGGSVYTNGSSGNRVQVASSTDFAFGTGDFTIEGWFDLPSIGSNDYLFDIGTNGLYVRFVSGVLTYFNGTNNQTTGTTSQLLPINSWNHIALVRNSGSTTMYINGKSVPGITAIADTVDWTNSATVTLMDYGAGAASVETEGFVSDFRITKGSAVYTADFIPSDVVVSDTAETVLHIKAGNADIVDKTQSATITLVGNTTTSSTQSKYASSSIYLDGTGDYAIINIPAMATAPLGTRDWTMELWFNTAGTNASYLHFFTLGDSFAAGNGLVLDTYQGNLRIWNGADRTFGTTPTFSADTWHHLAVVSEGGDLHCYFDGTEVGSGILSQNFSATHGYPEIWLGAYSNSGYGTPYSSITTATYFEDVRFTLDLARYTANFTPPAQSLQA